MISMKAVPGQQFAGETGTPYIADHQGNLKVYPVDVIALKAAGAECTILPATLNLKTQTGHELYFNGGTHSPDAAGIIRDVPFDVAVEQIKAGTCTEATEEDAIAEAPEATVAEPITPEGAAAEATAPDPSAAAGTDTAPTVPTETPPADTTTPPVEAATAPAETAPVVDTAPQEPAPVTETAADVPAEAPAETVTDATPPETAA